MHATTEDIEEMQAQIQVLQEQVRRLANAITSMMRTEPLREHFSNMGDYGPRYMDDRDYREVASIAHPDPDEWIDE